MAPNPTHPRTHIGTADTEHTQNCATPTTQPDTEHHTLGDHIRAYLQHQKRQLKTTTTTQPAATTPTTTPTASTAKETAHDEPPPF